VVLRAVPRLKHEQRLLGYSAAAYAPGCRKAPYHLLIQPPLSETDMIKLDTLMTSLSARRRRNDKVVRQNATVPVLAHGKGVCHTFWTKPPTCYGKKIALNAKCQRPGVCTRWNIAYSQDIADKFLRRCARTTTNPRRGAGLPVDKEDRSAGRQRAEKTGLRNIFH